MGKPSTSLCWKRELVYIEIIWVFLETKQNKTKTNLKLKSLHTCSKRKPPPTAVAASFPTFWNKNPAHLKERRERQRETK